MTMKNTFCLIILLALSLVGFGQNSDYYYYKSKKVSLYKSNTRHYILINNDINKNEMIVKLSQDNFTLEKINPNKVRNSFSDHKRNSNDGNWAIVKGSDKIKDYDWITYRALISKMHSKVFKVVSFVLIY
tara:strand:- start:251 stop:640 length:390 start_codon:yes stop_codon:yes gene_type:complete